MHLFVCRKLNIFAFVCSLVCLSLSSSVKELKEEKKKTNKNNNRVRKLDRLGQENMELDVEKWKMINFNEILKTNMGLLFVACFPVCPALVEINFSTIESLRKHDSYICYSVIGTARV